MRATGQKHPDGLNETHAPALRSWVTSANRPDTDFPIQNLPFSIFRSDSTEHWRAGVAIGDSVLDLAKLAGSPRLSGMAADACQAALGDSLNSLMALGPDYWSALRLALSRVLREGVDDADDLRLCLYSMPKVEYRPPVRVGDFTDFYTSIHHARNGGRLRRPEAPLADNYVWIPIAYHGRASSIRVSRDIVLRPFGQLGVGSDGLPEFGPSRKMDFELELAFYVGCPNPEGTRIPMAKAENHLFGVSLLNDWSSRDIQTWESQPLGPFQAKNFASTVSPWVVTWEALLPFRVPATRDAGDPQPLPYLFSQSDRKRGALDIRLTASLQSRQMQEAGIAPQVLCTTNSKHAFWTAAQMVAHHTVNGCNLQVGDMLGTGTLSGPNDGAMGCLLEITRGGKESFDLPSGEKRTYLEDFDVVTLQGRCESAPFVSIGFGSCVSTLLPELASDG